MYGFMPNLHKKSWTVSTIYLYIIICIKIGVYKKRLFLTFAYPLAIVAIVAVGPDTAKSPATVGDQQIL